MQLTRFDRWLREKFVHETHIYSLRPPEHIPKHTKVTELPDEPGRKYRYRFIPKNNKAMDALIHSLNEHNQMYTTRIIDRKTWITRIVAREDKSFTWWCVWVVFTAVGVAGLYRIVVIAWNNETFRENLRGAIETFKG